VTTTKRRRSRFGDITVRAYVDTFLASPGAERGLAEALCLNPVSHHPAQPATHRREAKRILAAWREGRKP